MNDYRLFDELCTMGIADILIVIFCGTSVFGYMFLLFLLIGGKI